MESSPTISKQDTQGIAVDGWKDLLDKMRKPCLLADLDLHMQVHPDYDTAPDGVSVSDGKGKSLPSARPICQKIESFTVKCRVADMVVAGMVLAAVMVLLCGMVRMCCCMKR